MVELSFNRFMSHDFLYRLLYEAANATEACVELVVIYKWTIFIVYVVIKTLCSYTLGLPPRLRLGSVP